MIKLIRAGFISKLFAILVLSLWLSNGAKAGCDDAPVDGVDYSNCQFSEGHLNPGNIQGTSLIFSNLGSTLSLLKF